MKVFVLVFQAVLLFAIFIVAIYNWLHFVQTSKVEKKLGIILPSTVKSMLVVNLVIPLLAMGALAFFFLSNLVLPS